MPIPGSKGTARRGRHNGTVHRRPVILALVASTVTAALAACSADPAPTTAEPPAASAPAAPSASAGAPAPAGIAPQETFAVTTRTLSLRRGADRPLPTTVWLPQGDGPFPLILFSHGLGGKPRDYRSLLTIWAQAGFAVAAPTYPHTSAGAKDLDVADVLNQPADASYVITEVLGELGDVVDQDRIAAAGHSAGGVTTIGLFSSARDKRLRAGVVLAGRRVLNETFTGSEAPLLFVHGRQDPTVTYADGKRAYDAVTWPKAFLSVTDGGHIVTGRALDVVAETSTDFWRWSLYGDETAKQRLKADATTGDVATLADEL